MKVLCRDELWGLHLDELYDLRAEVSCKSNEDSVHYLDEINDVINFKEKDILDVDKCEICNGSGLTTQPVEHPDGEGGFDSVNETVVCECQ